MNKILIRGALMLFTLLPMLAFAQTPRYYWKFDNPGNPRVNHANTAATEDITNPVANHLIWTSGHRDNGPVGSYLQVGESTIPNPNPNNYVGYATISYNGGNFPTSWNPNGVTMEVLVRMDFPTYKLPILNFQERMFLWFNQGNITARIFEDNCNGQIGHTIVQPLTGYGRLDECYYLNGDWHHFALRFNYDEVTESGFFNVFVDGLTLPEFTLPIDFRPKWKDLMTSQGVSVGALNYILRQAAAFDEFAVWDEALSDEMILQHFQDFQAGRSYSETTSITALPPLASLPSQSPNLQRNEADYVPGFDPNNPPISVLPGTSTFASQLQEEYPLPRYRTNHAMRRNHQYIGYLPFTYSTKPQPANATTQVVNNISEMYDFYNYSFYIGSLTTAHTDVANSSSLMSQLINAANSRNAEVTLSNQWGGAKTVQVGNGASSMLIYADIHGIPIGNGNGPQNFPAPASNFRLPATTPAIGTADHFYFQNDAANPVTGNFDFFAYNPGGEVSMAQNPSSTGRSLRPDADPWIGEMDGRAMGNVIQEVEAQGVEVGLIIENGELPPSPILGHAYERIAGTGPAIITANNGNTVIGDSRLLNSTTAANSKRWSAGGKHNLRTAMRNFMVNGACSTCGNASQVGNPLNTALPDFLYYQVHGTGPWDFETTHEINLRQSPGPSNQRHLSTPDLYPARASAWNNGISGTGTQGLNEMIRGRLEELTEIAGVGSGAVRYGYFPNYIPAVAPGIDAGGPASFPFNASETVMMRPGYYLGLLKAAAMLGAENMIAFQTNLSQPQLGRPHDASWWGWQYAMPAYTQATFSREENLFTNSVIMNGNMGEFRRSGTLGFQGGLRFWAGKEDYVVMARRSVDNIADATCSAYNCPNSPLSLGLTSHYLIMGTLQQSKASTEHDANNPSSPVYADNVNVEIDGMDMQFEIRKQGSTYVLDNTVPTEPVFYQLDGWHETGHPSRWSKCFVMEAEVFDGLHNSPNAHWNRVTKNPLDQPASDYNFVNATTYMQASAGSTPANLLSLTYRFHPRFFQPAQTTQKRMLAYARVRATKKSELRMELSTPNGGVIFSSINSVPQSDNWYWIPLHLNGTSPSLPTFSNQDYDLKLSIFHDWLHIDKVVLCPADTSQSEFQPVADATGTWSAPAGPYCKGEELQVTLALTGISPWTFQYQEVNTSSTTLHTIENITDPAFSFTIPLNNSGSLNPMNPIALYDANGAGTFTSGNITINLVNTPPPIITSTGDLCAQSTNVTLSVNPGYQNLLWNTGETTSNITVMNPGLYQVSGDINGCRVSSDFKEVLQAQSVITSNTGDFAICPTESIKLTVTGGTANANYSWRRNGQTILNSNSVNLTVSQPGVYEVFEVSSTSCDFYGAVEVFMHEFEVTRVGSVCSGDDPIQLSPDPGTGSWTSFPANLIVANRFDPGLVQNPNNQQVVSVTLTYKHNYCGACTLAVGKEIQTVDVYFNCNECLARTGENLIEDGSFTPVACPVTTFATLLNPNCPASGTGTLMNYLYTVTDNPNNFGLANWGDRTGLPGSGMFLGHYDDPVARVVFSQNIAVQTGRTYAFSAWFTNLLTAAGYRVDFFVDGILIGIGISNGIPAWEQYGGSYSASSTGMVLLEIKLTAIAATSGNHYAFAMDDLSFGIMEEGLRVLAPSQVCDGSLVGIQILGGNNLTTYTIDGNVANQGNDWTVYLPVSLGVNTYTVVMTGLNCNVTTKVRVEGIVCPCKACPDPEDSGLASQVDMAQFKVFPNPSQGIFTLQGDLSQVTNLHWEVITLMGTTVLKGDAPAAEGRYEDQIDLSRLSNGTYILLVSNGQDRNVFRLVKQ